jgi:cell division transport system permease protein
VKTIIRQVWFSVQECGLNIRRSLLLTLVSVMTIGICLTILGGFGTISLNVMVAIQHLREKVDMEVYLVDGLNSIQTDQVHSQIQGLAGIKSLVYISKDEARREGRINQEYLSILDHNPLPASFRLAFKEGSRTDSYLGQVAADIQQLSGVEEVVYGREWITVLDRITQTFIVLDLLLGLVICLALAFVVANTIRLTYVKRKDDVEVMQLVGATRRMIKRPFVMEGMGQGFLGGTGAALILHWGIRLVNPHIFLPLTVPDKRFLGILIALGVFLGYLGSTFSIGSYIKSVRRET